MANERERESNTEVREELEIVGYSMICIMNPTP